MTPLTVLRDVRALLTDPARWCKGHFAHDARGKSTDHHGEQACAWCVTGAVFRLCNWEWMPYQQVRQLLMVCIPQHLELRYTHAPSAYNDRAETTHADVLAWLDAAIARAQEGQNAGQSLA